MKSKKPKEENKMKKDLNTELTPEEAKARKQYKKNLIISLICGIIIIIYFIILNAIVPLENFNTCIKVSYIVLIIISIIIFEIAYKKGKKELIVTGIELIALAVHTILIEKNIVTVGKEQQFYILSTSYIWPTYYCLKALLIYTKENRRKLKQISDIAEIVKEEKPTKKVAKKRKK